MAVLKRIFLAIILIILFSFNICYGIDENQLTVNGAVSSDTNTDLTENNTTQNLSTQNTTTQNQNSPSTTVVSNISSKSNTSTFTNMLYIVLIVIGVLLILLAIAILIRLH